MSPEEVIDQAFAVIREQYPDEDRVAAGNEAISAQIAEGFAQAERGELITPEDARQMPITGKPRPDTPFHP